MFNRLGRNLSNWKANWKDATWKNVNWKDAVWKGTVWKGTVWKDAIWKGAVWKYGVAIGLVLLALLLTRMLDTLIQPAETPFLLFVGAVTLSALYGGRNAGILAALLSVCVQLSGARSHGEPLDLKSAAVVQTAVQTAAFILQSGLISVLVGSLSTKQTVLGSAGDRGAFACTQAEQQLQHTLHTLQTLVAASPLPIVVIESGSVEPGCPEPGCIVRLWNPAAERTFGWSAEEVLGKPLPIVPLEKQEECRQVRAAVVRGEIFSGIETYRSRRDGSDVLVSVSAALLDNQDNGAILLLFQDITAQQQTEMALRASEERFSLAVNQAGMATWDVNLQTGATVWSENHFTLLGYEPRPHHEVNDELWRSRVLPEDRPFVQQAVDRVQQDRSLCQVEYRIQRADTGEIRWLSAYARFVYDAAGQPARFIGIFFDVTDRKRIELERERLLQALADERARFEAVLRQMPGGIMVADAVSGQLVLCNEQANHLLRHTYHLGYQPQESEAGVLFVGYGADGQPYERDRYPLVRSLQTGEIISHEEIEIRFQDGNRIFLDVSATPVFNSHGDLISAVTIFQDITRRKQTEIALREGEERLRLAMEVGRMTAWEWNPIEDRVMMYTGSANITGLPQVNAAQHGLSHVHPDDRSRHQATVEQALATQSGYHSEFRFLRPDTGELIWLEERGKVLLHKDGTLQKMIGAAIDITARKQIEADLQQSNDRFFAAMQAVEGIVFEWNLETQTVYRSDGLFDLVGVRAEDAPPTSEWWIARVHPEDVARLETIVPSILAGSERYESEYRVRHAAGHWIYVWERGYLQRNAAGEVITIVGFTTDVTDRKWAEMELRQKNAILDVINESAPTPIFVKDREGRIIYANPATLRVFGKSAAEVIGFCDCDITAPLEEALQVMANDRRIMESGQMEVVEESPDGVRTFLGMKVPFRNEAGEVVGLIGIANDITDRVQLERDRERILQQEQAAREAAEQANRIKDEFLAVLSHELRSPLNPILGWTKLLQSGKLDAAQSAQALETIERNAKLQSQLVEDLLDISRIMRGKLTLNKVPVSLPFVVSAAIETVRLAAEAKQIEIVLSLPPIEAQVWGDAARLQQVVWNLLTNAVKFTPNGGRVEVKLESVESVESVESFEFLVLSSELANPPQNSPFTAPSSTPQPQPPILPTQNSKLKTQNSPPQPPTLPTQNSKLKTQNSFVQLTVTDTGKGISPAFLPHVFDYFRQEDGSTTRRFGGLGLGLAIVRQIVELHGGTVQADSLGEGQGATFTVMLPLLGGGGAGEQGSGGAGEQGSNQANPAAASTDLLTPDAQRPTPDAPPLPLSGLQILLVDDDRDTREFQTFVLEQQGATVTAVASAAAAIAVLAEQVPDLLISDIGMPETNGYGLMQQIRDRGAESSPLCFQSGGTPDNAPSNNRMRNRQIPAIALTAYAAEADQTRAIAAGFQRHLAKPVDPANLVKTILELTARSANG